jgi:hypothetical protein
VTSMKRKLRDALNAVADALAELSIDELENEWQEMRLTVAEFLERRHPAKYREWDDKFSWQARVRRNRSAGARKATQARKARTRVEARHE